VLEVHDEPQVGAQVRIPAAICRSACSIAAVRPGSALADESLCWKAYQALPAGSVMANWADCLAGEVAELLIGHVPSGGADDLASG
jgi:hypothetical protein